MTQIGIDLGTTNSLVAYMTDEGPQLISNALGDFLTPSVVSIDNDEIIVGKTAKERLISHPNKTAAFFKRHMGTKKQIQLGEKVFSAEELSSFILCSLKQDAENFLQTEVTRVVISAPAYFNDTQRKAIINAASLAGLQVDLLINEPTAAALAYGVTQSGKDSQFLVFDLGGGTFDVSVLDMFDDVIEVQASAGDSFLGGEDFIDAIAVQFIEELNLDGMFKKASDEVRAKIREAAQKALFDLDSKQETAVDFVVNNKEHTAYLSRHELEKITQPLLEKIRKPIERSLNDSNINPSELNDVFLVGGATRMPIVRALIARMLGVIPNQSLHPDEVVAKGAAVQAGLFANHNALKDTVMTDVCPFSLGISSGSYFQGKRIDDVFSPIIERNTPIPVSRESYYQTVEHNQKDIGLHIYQGESAVASDNILLKELDIPVPINKAGEERISVRFTYDPSGILDVDVTVLSTQAKHNALIEQNEGSLSPEEIEQKRKKLEKLKVLPKDMEQYRYLLERLNNLYEGTLGDNREYIANILFHYRQILDSQDMKKIHIESALVKQEVERIETFLKKV